MVTKLGHHMNKPVLVSIPPIFGNTELHRCRLIGAEAAGLWLESDDFSRIAGGHVHSLPASVFVPFAQIACLAEAPAVPLPGKPAPIVSTAEAPRRARETPSVGTRKKSR
jgi:hypothetical protein